MSVKTALSTLLALGLASAAYPQISGVVRYDGDPLPGVVVQIAGGGLKNPIIVATDAEGRYRFDAVPPGKFELTATLAGFGLQVVKVCTDGSDQQIDLDLYIHVTHCYWFSEPMLQPTTEEIAGTVLDGAGREVSTALVQILANERVVATTSVDSAGKFAVLVPLGTTAVRILAAGFADRTITDFRDLRTKSFRVYRACP